MGCTFLIFGASGDLTKRKLIPALYQLFRKQRLPSNSKIVGLSRTPMTDDEWRDRLIGSTREFASKDFEEESFREFCKTVFYRSIDISKAEDFARIDRDVREIEDHAPNDRIYYLSTSPKLYEKAVENLGKANMVQQNNGARRIVIEKPFGVDSETSQKLNRSLHSVFDESQIYRIDHYLGKETVQNLMVLRFANSIFEPIWNRNYVDHVQITVAEEVDVAQRAGYYDGSGVLRDMFQNHLLQLMTITAMEAPARFDADLIRNEKVKVLEAVRGLDPQQIGEHSVRAQYDGYLDADGVPSDSRTATFAALKLWVDNWRWQGVPFYLRSGKAMSCRTTQIVVQFRQPPHALFESPNQSSHEGNRLVVQVQPAEGIQLHFQTKVPDAEMNIRMTDLAFRFDREFSGSMPDSYQRLLLDAAEGDPSLFARSDEVEKAWNIIDPFLKAWVNDTNIASYPKGQWGSQSSSEWMAKQGREWFDVCPVLH